MAPDRLFCANIGLARGGGGGQCRAMSTPLPPYPDGFAPILARFDRRQDPILFHAGTQMLPADADLAALAAQVVADPATDPDEQDPRTTRYFLKRRALRDEFTGRSELCFWHGFVIACLRKSGYPEHFPALFERMWAEQAPHLLAHLDLRWLVSAATTFGDVGPAPGQRTLGLALSVLMNTMKLYESERVFSGLPPQVPFAFGKRAKGALPMQMDGFAIRHGDADVQMLARLWRLSEAEPVMAPLGRALLTALAAEDGTVFARLMAMRRLKQDKP